MRPPSPEDARGYYPDSVCFKIAPLGTPNSCVHQARLKLLQAFPRNAGRRYNALDTLILIKKYITGLIYIIRYSHKEQFNQKEPVKRYYHFNDLLINYDSSKR